MKHELSQNTNHFIDGKKILFHTSLLAGIYIYLFFICYPILINADIESTADEAHQFRQTLEFLQGRFFYIMTM